MERQVCWAAWDTPGLEHLRLWQHGETIEADALLIAVVEGTAIRLRYTITCDLRWRMRSADLIWLEQQQTLQVRTDGEGHWRTAAGRALPDLDGCLEVDISLTPFTNTLPIRRLALKPGEAAGARAAYVDVVQRTLYPLPQRYTHLRSEHDAYRYEALSSDFCAELPVDGDGLVMDYPGLFRRVWSW